MKRLLSILGLLGLSAGFLASPISALAITDPTYDGPADTNYYADIVVNYNGIMKTEDTTDASDVGIKDVEIGADVDNAFYIGFDEKFDGFIMGFESGEGSDGGAYRIDYYNGSTWSALVAESASGIPGTSNAFTKEWDRPSDWAKTTIPSVRMESGSTSTTDSLYFVKIVITDRYLDTIKASRIGLKVYNLELTLQDELGNAITSHMENTFTSLYDAHYYIHEDAGNGLYKYGFFTTDSATERLYSLEQNADGFVSVDADLYLSKVTEEKLVTMHYAHKISAKDSATSSDVTLTSLTGGTANTSCTISGGDAYCAIPEDEDNSSATAYASGYDSETFTLPNRTANTDDQALTTLGMDASGATPPPTTDDPDLTVNDIYLTGDALEIDVGNQGEGNVLSSDSSVWIYAYIDGNLEYSDSYSYTYFEAHEGHVFTILDGTFDESGETYEVEVCIDATDTVDETDEGDNCRTENLTTSGTSTSDQPDLETNDVYIDSDTGDVMIAVENTGSEDVDNGEIVWIYAYVDGDKEWSRSSTQSSSSNTWLDLDEEETYNIGDLDDLIEGHGSTYEIEVCTDATDTVDEESESNNCMTVDEDSIEEKSPSVSPDDVDLETTDIYLDEDNGDVMVTVENTGGDDVDSGEIVWIYAYVDGDKEWSKSATQSSSTTNWLDEGEEDTYNVGDLDDLIDGHGSTYEIEICVDATETVDGEESESNNCMTVDEDSIEEETDSESCGNFYDINGHWAEDYICDLFDRDVVSGKTSTTYSPNGYVTRAEFLKMVLLNADIDPYAVTSVHYDDVDSHDWFYDYVTYATTEDYVEGYDDGDFKPNNYVTRAEAVTILMRVAEETLYSFDESDIDFWDVDKYDWFAYAVILADDYNIVDGYSDSSFRPYDYIDRGAAAKIVSLAYDEFYAD
ncbi:MAG: S-layer homology domain-containing protein [Candidatus Gracilibacteria bacterium]